MNKSNHRSPFAIVGRLIVLVKPMLPIMLAAIVMGVAGHFCATFITIFGGFGILRALGLASPVRTVGTAFACILVFALLRGVLRYAEQASNHYIAFKLLALIRDKVFGALRRLTPAKLEGRDRGDLISLITADIEALEVFYAHTISPICIAFICVIGMTGFVGSWHILPALVLLAGYLLVGVALPVWSAKRGDRAAREYRQALADTNSYVLESLRGLKDTLQYQDTAARAEGITAHSEMLGEKQKAMKYREGLTVAITNTLILLTVLAVLGVSLNLYQSGKMGVEGVLVCTLSALSSFGPVVALANLGASLTQVFASADRVLDLLDEQPVTADVTDGTDTAFAGAAAEHVNFAYAKEEVLHDLSLTIPEKKIVGITGRSGSGKSTFLRLLMRFWDVSSGSIRFGAEDICRVNTAALREQESLVTQETELFDDTIENNIRIAKRDATREEVEAACKKAALDSFIRSLPKGYDTPVGELGGALSGGERQRIGVARAFLHDAPFLLLDLVAAVENLVERDRERSPDVPPALLAPGRGRRPYRDVAVLIILVVDVRRSVVVVGVELEIAHPVAAHGFQFALLDLAVRLVIADLRCMARILHQYVERGQLHVDVIFRSKPLQVAVFEFGWCRLALRRCGDSSQQQPECEDGPFHMLLGFKHFLSV